LLKGIFAPPDPEDEGGSLNSLRQPLWAPKEG
jgi:hypothetical protein